MKKASKESMLIAHYISSFLNEYVPSQKTASTHTLKAYQDALVLYMTFLETQKSVRCEELCGQCYKSTNIEEWLRTGIAARIPAITGLDPCGSF